MSAGTSRDFFHPIAEIAFRALRAGVTEPLDLGDEGLAAIRAALRSYAGEALAAAAHELFTLACFLDREKHCPSAAKQILGVLQEVIPASEPSPAETDAPSGKYRSYFAARQAGTQPLLDALKAPAKKR